MFEKFTERARQVIVLAQQEARDAQVSKIDTACLLAGLILEEGGIATRVLAKRNIQIDEVRESIPVDKTQIPPTEEEKSLPIPFTAETHKVLELALKEALQLGHNYISTEHILLGLVRYQETLPCKTFNLDDSIKDDIIELLRGPRWQQERKRQQSEWAKALTSGRHNKQKNIDDLLKSATRMFNAAAQWLENQNKNA